MKLTEQDIISIENFWTAKSRHDFLSYRMYTRGSNFLYNWFVADLCKQLQQFYVDYTKGLRPVLILNTPPQHGKSWAVSDFISWIVGMVPTLRIIFGSFSERLGKRCNTSIRRTFNTTKYKNIFPDFEHGTKDLICNSEHIETTTEGIEEYGYFRNTTVSGAVTGETLDVGVIDDPVKGRAEANSPKVSETIWEWFNDDFATRSDDMGGIIVVMTRWGVNDLAGRMIDSMPNIKVVNYKAISTNDEPNRKVGQPLFSDLKSLEFLEKRKAAMAKPNWESLYQGSPTVTGGNLIKDHWWRWYKTGHLPKILYKFITADTAQKTKTYNDYTVFQCWGYGVDGRIYLLDKFREKLESPELRREAEMFYKRHDTKRNKADDAILRGMYIEDKSSGSGLIQELKRKRLKVYEVQRNTDKVFRVEDASPQIELGNVVLNTSINGVDNLTKEAREFPNSEFDDDIDTCIQAIEVVYINKEVSGSLVAAMTA